MQQMSRKLLQAILPIQTPLKLTPTPLPSQSLRMPSTSKAKKPPNQHFHCACSEARPTKLSPCVLLNSTLKIKSVHRVEKTHVDAILHDGFETRSKNDIDYLANTCFALLPPLISLRSNQLISQQIWPIFTHMMFSFPALIAQHLIGQIGNILN